MGEIIPRWEWRTFGASFGVAEDRIRASGAPNTRHSSEVYIIARHSSDNTKIRNELMDIKTLQNTDEHGLEQWYPVMKSGFPLPLGELEKVCRSWNVEMPGDLTDAVPYDDFLTRIVGQHPELRAVRVVKARHGYSIDGTTAELADLEIEDMAIRTVCVEHADPDLVWRVVTDLGLADHENTNYLKAIKRIVGWL